MTNNLETFLDKAWEQYLLSDKSMEWSDYCDNAIDNYNAIQEDRHRDWSEL